MAAVVGETEAIDRTDREILRILRDDARIPWQALASRVHLSANATADRVRRLSRRGVIRRFTVDIDQAALGRGLEAVIDVLVNPGHGEQMEHDLRGRDEVTWLAHMTGRLDYRMTVSCDGTKGLDDFLKWLRDHGARETNTTVVLRRVV
jgi:Lrp/AsnC family transcriptional regulator, leucine-responsive regulatory protein